MKTSLLVLVLFAFAGAASITLLAQETKPVPKDSMRISIRGCTKGYILTAAPRTVEEPGSFEVKEGMHFRMNAPKAMMSEIKGHEGSMLVVTGLIKKGQYQEGVGIGGGVRVSPGTSAPGGMPSPASGQNFLDVEGWRQTEGSCPSK